MKLQEKFREMSRESELIPEEIIEEKIAVLLRQKSDVKTKAIDSFIYGFDYALDCVLDILERFKINPEL